MNEIILITVLDFLINWGAENVNNFVENDSFKQKKK